MADVTDNPFRKIITEIGRPDIFVTEFVASDGLAHPDAKDRLQKQILSYDKNQRPIIAQIFGGNPENYFIAAKLCAELGFDGIDINTGCPQKNILKQIAGSELIKIENRDLMAELIAAAKNGIKASGKNIPLSVKTRLGFNEIDFS
jgi:tRNA-dihydrouridine synthase